ncbi:MAG: DUF433 domain-containing protein [Candidatus Omnitrophica bacterium]|nr:DUF433 domain-containing protein [Candidatus Omnitrophota bacterium]
MTDRIMADIKVCGGEPCVKGTRIPVRVVLSHLAAGDTAADLLRDFPGLTAADIRACLEYASYLATERVA